MSAHKSFNLNEMFNVSVVHKMVIGFSSLAILLIVTSGLAYIGLADIKRSAEEVAFEKMPIQRSVSTTNQQVLNLARLTTNAYFETDSEALASYKQDFDKAYSEFQVNVSTLSTLVSEQNASTLEEALDTSKKYLDSSVSMFDSKQAKLNNDKLLQDKVQESFDFTDEASALMLDLSYIEGDSQDIEALIGMSTSIDNKLGIMLNNIDEILKETDADSITNIIGDLDYSLGNVLVDLDYAKRIAENIDDQGILDMFEEQFASAKNSMAGDNGVFSLKRRQLELIESASVHRLDASSAINQALSALKRLSESVNSAALEGQQNILDAVQSNVIKSLGISILGIAATAILAFIATRSIAKPLSAVNKQLRILSQGDLSDMLDDSGNDEFSELAKNVNLLISSLHTLIGEINEKEANLRKVTLESIEMGDKSLQQVAEQQTQIDVTNENTQRIKQTSQSNMQQIDNADNKIIEAISQSDRVVNLVQQSANQVNEQAIQAKKSAEIVHRLGENSNKIGSILDVIKTIAEQTNLLALNAAIEAARAGEQGRGFAVVADEVRTLATRTQNSTEEIEKMIAALQIDSQQAVSAMNEGSEQVQKGVEITTEVTLQVNQIKTIIESLADVNRHIVSDTKSQDAYLDEVVNRLDKIVHLSRDSAQSTRASNDATHEIENEMNALRAAVGQFKLN
jgi:methyl-accepting chemotaxis protein